MATAPSPARSAWQSASGALVRAFHRYANWLVGISWKRFVLLSILLIISAAILEELPPFRWRVTELVSEPHPSLPVPPLPPRPRIKIDKQKPGAGSEGVDISIDEHGIRIKARPSPEAASAASAPSAASAASAASQALAEPPAAPPEPLPPVTVPEVRIDLPPNATREQVREAAREAKQAVQEALQEARDAIEEAQRDAEEARREAEQAERDGVRGPRIRTRTTHVGDFLSDLALLWIVGSAIIKVTYKGRLQAEVKAAEATEVAEAESLKRQVVEARMAAMQAQVEPHFLFNTLASIDHLIETDPSRASRMQKNLIALLRASMPTLREANDGGLRDLGRELAVIRPYLEILKVRMEERLQTSIDVPEGLHSAQFPPMMIQTLVENAIKHGLEPKAEGGSLSVKAEIVHGKLAVTVADTGLGFGKAATAGTGVGLANIRERLQLLYGSKATLAITENVPQGTIVTITVPYAARPMEGEAA